MKRKKLERLIEEIQTMYDYAKKDYEEESLMGSIASYGEMNAYVSIVAKINLIYGRDYKFVE